MNAYVDHLIELQASLNALAQIIFQNGLCTETELQAMIGRARARCDQRAAEQRESLIQTFEAETTKPCKCGAKAILLQRRSFPGLIERVWWCNCGNIEAAESLKVPTEAERLLARWVEVNQK